MSARPAGLWTLLGREAAIALLAVLATAGLAAQAPNPAHLSRVFLAEAFALHAMEMDGTQAWSLALPSVPDSVAGVVLDGHGYVWTGDLYAQAVRRFTVTGQLDATFYVPGPLGTVIFMPAVDRDGNCYAGKLEPDPYQPFGYRNRIVKLDPSGILLWDFDLTPELAWSNPAQGLLDQIKVDEDGAVWATLNEPLFAANQPTLPTGGRTVRLSPQGQVLASFEPGGDSIQINPDRTVRVYQTNTNWHQVFSFSGVLLQSTFTGVGRESIPHVSGAPLSTTNGFIYGPIYGSVTVGAGFGYAPVYSGFLGTITSLPMPPQTGIGVAPDALGRLWAIGYDMNMSRPYALRYGPFNTVNGEYPVWSQYQLSATPQTHVLYRQNQNEGGRFTIYDWCLNVDPWGDLDLDGVMNRNELFEGTSPADPASVTATLGVSGLGIGQTAAFAIAAPGQGNGTYASILSLTPGPIRLPDQRGFAPDFQDPLAAYWLTAGPPAVNGAIGNLDGSGLATISALVPNEPALVGLNLVFGVGTLDPTWSLGVRTLYGPRVLTIGP